MKLGKTFHFDAAHHLPDHYHCGHIHGHTYHLTVIVKGASNSPSSSYPGMVIDLKELSDKVNLVINKLDHEYINTILPGFLPTCENLCGWFFDQLSIMMPQNITEVTIRLQEGNGGWAEDTWTI